MEVTHYKFKKKLRILQHGDILNLQNLVCISIKKKTSEKKVRQKLWK